ncbi:hypothetical protein GMLC_19860 [Geomonas limicola]|uniref:Peptidase S9 prolyl oligopeptidase catalytic domain-containing protein n=1 Tax=Geomonas limicola TaxID=2740186 RepID=A0A6V8N9D6_9BACT|nr:prolyl oligopeptidase family serine peptidase [Geomonas limicola]GFO68407.1 hypothetical protein GMLC_19860 [Geomonas limicola]
MTAGAVMEEILVRSSVDGAKEPALWFHPVGSDPVPLVVGLHTWSYDRFNQVEGMLPRCRERGWALLLPEFRGPNLSSNPRATEAAGSALAITDIYDAIQQVSSRFALQENARFLLGGSGGGHMALLTAATSPTFWRGVSAWVPITDLAAWREENPEYAEHVAACCGGIPGDSEDLAGRYRERSPLSYLDALARVNLSVHHGRHDDVVSYRHSWKLAQALEERGADHFFFEIFDGAHDIHYGTAFDWFGKQLTKEAAESIRLTG